MEFLRHLSAKDGNAPLEAKLLEKLEYASILELVKEYNQIPSVGRRGVRMRFESLHWMLKELFKRKPYYQVYDDLKNIVNRSPLGIISLLSVHMLSREIRGNTEIIQLEERDLLRGGLHFQPKSYNFWDFCFPSPGEYEMSALDWRAERSIYTTTISS